MLFILIFIVLTLALPLSVEIYKKGSDNIMSRSGKELAKTKTVALMIYLPNKMLGALGDFAQAAVALATVGVIFFVIWKLLAFVLRLLF